MWGEGGRHGDDEPRDEEFVFVGADRENEPTVEQVEAEIGDIDAEMSSLARELDLDAVERLGKAAVEERRVRFEDLKSRRDTLGRMLSRIRGFRS